MSERRRHCNGALCRWCGRVDPSLDDAADKKRTCASVVASLKNRVICTVSFSPGFGDADAAADVYEVQADVYANGADNLYATPSPNDVRSVR